MRCENWKGKDNTGIIYSDMIVKVYMAVPFIQGLENPCYILSRNTQRMPFRDQNGLKMECYFKILLGRKVNYSVFRIPGAQGEKSLQSE